MRCSRRSFPRCCSGTMSYSISLEGAPELDDTTSMRLFGGRKPIIAGVEFQGLVPQAIWVAYDPLVRQVEQALQLLLLRSTGAAAIRTAVERQTTGSADPRVAEFLVAFLMQPSVRSKIGRAVGSAENIGAVLAAMPQSARRELVLQVPEFLERHVRTKDTPAAFARRPLPGLLNVAALTLANEVGGIRHIGPLREAPRPIYELPSTDTQDVGLESRVHGLGGGINRPTLGCRPMGWATDGRAAWRCR